jgi:hypothetical protein
VDFLIKYLGLPLSNSKLSKSLLQTLVDCVTDKLPASKGRILHRPHPHQDDTICCPDLYLHQHQLAEVATKSDSKNTESLSLIGFRGGPYQDLHCGMEHSTKALSCGGLGVPDMKLLGIALRARWLLTPSRRCVLIMGVHSAERGHRDSGVLQCVNSNFTRRW